MKKSFLFTIIATIAIVCLFLLSKHLICGNSLEIFFVSSQKHSAQDLNYKGGLNAYEWFIISGHVQKSNLEKEGYHIPDVDFNKNNLIISRYKISKLYRRAGNSPCTGVPDGRVIFDKDNSSDSYYYFYLIPKVALSQGIG